MIEGTKYDYGKPQLRLLPYTALEEVGDVLTYGAEKYAPENWRHVTPLEERYTDAALRHLFAHLQGEVDDPESGIRHLAHAVANLLFVMEGGIECQDTNSHVTIAIPDTILQSTTKSTETLNKLPIPRTVQSVKESLDGSTDCLELNFEGLDLLVGD